MQSSTGLNSFLSTTSFEEDNKDDRGLHTSEISSFSQQPFRLPASIAKVGQTDTINSVAPFLNSYPPSTSPTSTPKKQSRKMNRIDEEYSNKSRSNFVSRTPIKHMLPWERIESIIWATTPLLFHLLGALVLIVAIFQYREPFLSVSQMGEGSTGLLEYGFLGACVTAPNSTIRTCSSPELLVNFIPQVLQVSPAMPGFCALKLLFVSNQTPPVILSSLICLWAALIIYIPLWILAYFPTRRPFPDPMMRFYRFHAKTLFIVIFALAFPAFIMTLTMSLGYQLLLKGNMNDFNLNMLASIEGGLIGGSITVWRATLGHGFNYLWVSCAFQAANIVAINVAMFHGLHEKVEWPEMQQDRIFW